MLNRKMHQENFDKKLEYTFHREFRWNFLGSILYECIKTIHQIGLLLFLTKSVYGLIGSTFSLIYFATKVADSGATQTLPPFYYVLMKNKKNFIELIGKYFIGPQILIGIIVSYLTTCFYQQHLLPSPYQISFIIVIPMLIMLETTRGFLRCFLHFSCKSRLVVCIESCSFTLYVMSIWIGFWCGLWPITLSVILLFHLIESTVIVLFFIVCTQAIYKKLDQPTEELKLPPKTGTRFWHARIFNYILRLSRELFTSHFITPLFAFKFGFNEVGLFYFVGAIMTSLQSIIKVSLGYSANMLFANIKNDTVAIKKKVFIVLSEKIVKIIIPIIILFGVLSKGVIKFYQTHSMFPSSVVLLFIFSIIVITEFFVILYEQFYIVEEASQKLFLLKIVEYISYYLFIIAYQSSSLIESLVRISLLRIISLTFMAYNAHSTWRIKPSFKTSKTYLAAWLVFGLFVFCTISFSMSPIFYLPNFHLLK